VKIGIGANKRIVVGKKKDADKSGIGIKIIGIARSSSTVGSKTSSYQLIETALSAMAIISMIEQIGSIRTMIGVLVGRLEKGHRFMIDWGRLSVHDRLGECVGYCPRNQEELEQMVDARVPNEFIFCRDANTYQMELRENRRQSVRQPQLPPWCPEGLTRTQKRMLQQERREELSRGENSAKSRD